MQLGEIASVRSGLVLSRKLSRYPTQYRYPLLNLRSFRENGTIDPDELEIYDAVEPLKEEYLTQQNDIVIRLSSPYTAVLIAEKDTGAVISSNFCVVRGLKRTFLPEYLYWLLNTPGVKQDIRQHTGSNMLGAVRAQYYIDFDIVPLPIAQQKQIAETNLLACREVQLLEALAKEKARYYTALLQKKQKEMRKGERK
ncbi:MAG: restriction endonuclease subunit S [Faecalibacterium sp.]|nr:restriction endonuclease subunit S [Faecalibacterium sp.]